LCAPLNAFARVQGPKKVAVRQVAARLAVEGRCADGRHTTETDAETGDEICRYCGKMIEL
jgi:hypothetical protein